MDKVRYIHMFSDDKFLASGGVSFSIYEDKERNKLCVGIAYCSPKDSFNRKIGRKISEENLKYVIEEYEKNNHDDIFVTDLNNGIVVGFVVNNDILMNECIFSQYEDTNNFAKHIKFSINHVEWTKFESLELKKLLIRYLFTLEKKIPDVRFPSWFAKYGI